MPLWLRFFSFHGCYYLLLLLLFILFLFPSPSQSICNQIDRDSLSTLIISRSSLNWSSETDCCNWEGISCDGNNRVSRLWLPSKSIQGQISPLFLNLTNLIQLNLSHNSLTGPLPDGFFTSLNRLQILDFSDNRFVGQLPETLSDSILTFNLSGNHFNGTITSSIFQSSPNLLVFDISNNSFNDPLPNSTCLYSPSLDTLDFSNNNFSDQIPTGLGSCSKLRVLRAGFNSLWGILPPEIFNCQFLQVISFPGNNLTGEIDNRVVNLTNLRVLELDGNKLTGEIPLDIGKLSKLETLLLHINQMKGHLPPSLMDCVNLVTLNLRVNSFEGQLSSLNFSRLSRLVTVDLGNNNFTGVLPVSLFSCPSLNAVRFASNQLVGELVPEIQQLKSLSYLSVSQNNLTNVKSAIKILTNCRNLSTLILSANFYGEELPSDETMAANSTVFFQNIHILSFGGCLFNGEIPNWLGNLKQLEVLDLSFNRFSGLIPAWFGDLPNLFYLDLSSNNLTGEFPIEFTRMLRLTSEGVDNQIDRSYLELPVFVNPSNTSTLQYYHQLANLPPAIYLGSNAITGSIPIQIGLLKFIHVLDLSYNNFSGTIPDQISNLVNLEKLNLSGNHLTGQIPSSLRSLHFLSSFSVANNNLQGPVPSGGQFDTFPSSSYDNNPGLCGLVVHRSCSSGSDTRKSNTYKNAKKNIIVGVTLGVCFIIAFAVVLTAVCLSKRRIIPRGEGDNVNFETISFTSNSGMSTDICKENSMLMIFQNNNNIEIKDITIHDILKATDNFNQANIVGCGGFGLVYKATLANGTKLAVKKLSGDMGLMEREFKAEVEVLSTARHKNLVSLQGYCVHDGIRLLIYSFMENGSLDYWLHEKTDGAAQLDWPTRLRIARGASTGLAYMHQICDPHIVHRDIKSSNILLNEKFEAHVADFGLSRLILPYRTHVTTELVGTLGYIPPEYGQAWIATLRGDMYSFGVVMLELLTGKRPVEVFKPKTSRELVSWVLQMKKAGKSEEIFDSLLRGKGFEEEMIQVLEMACMCINQNPLKRPTITEVVDWLHNVGAKK
ncbi:tyrosine-sulfated glycopeptide receptor 1-like [Impatiens glandulifera]|uniref:tyrosine-sulfated glycopeptide receptor 1-like n=1 Tax=Impatiens glandulifera TaxID=253017 RepID=UPI001FB14BAF|nr:tyrosine-sulfated glycopeptide receptor 1-like [Impatiens glandulifera]